MLSPLDTTKLSVGFAGRGDTEGLSKNPRRGDTPLRDPKRSHGQVGPDLGELLQSLQSSAYLLPHVQSNSRDSDILKHQLITFINLLRRY